MKRLLSIEFDKIWKNKASKILLITYFALITALSLFATVKFDFGPLKFYLAEVGIFNFPFIWHHNTYWAALLKIFLAVVIVSMMANEYSNGTLKQNLIDGLSKKEFILSKFLTVFVFAFISTITVFVVSMILGLIYSSYTEVGIIFSGLEYVAAYFIKLIGFFSFCLFLGILVKRSAFALGFLFVWFIFEKIIFASIHNWEYSSQAMNLLPLEAMSNLIREPFTRLNAIKSIGTGAGFDLNIDYSVPVLNIFVVLFWTVVFIFLSYKIIQKRDL